MNRDGERLPPGFVWVSRDEQTRCGEFVIEHRRERGDEGMPTVVVHDAQGRIVHEQQGTALGDAKGLEGFRLILFASYCGDLTGDGLPELVMNESIQCCSISHVVSLMSPPRRILRVNHGDGLDQLRPVKIEPGAAWQLATRQQVPVRQEPSTRGQTGPLPEGPHSFAVPLVLSLREGRYEASSLSSPEVFRKDRAALREECRREEICKRLVIAWLDSLLIGDWETERRDPIYAPWQPSLKRLAARQQRELRVALRREADSIRK